MSLLISRFLLRCTARLLAGAPPVAALFAAVLILGAMPGRAADPVVSNLKAVQREATKLVDISYDLAADAATVAVSLQISGDGGVTFAVPAVAVTGAVGPAVGPGTGKALTWDAGVDWNGQYSPQVRFKLVADDLLAPPGFASIPAGAFSMGDSLDGMADAPIHQVTVSAFYMEKTEVTKAAWDEVRAWAVGRGYTDLSAGAGKAANHPVHTVSWWDVIKWCNARSEKEGLVPCYTVGGNAMRTGTTVPTANWTAKGYRLPTEAEWEKAARGGLSGKRFPWGDTISHSQANYPSYGPSYAYDVSPTYGYHPIYGGGAVPYTSPVGSFPANAYGLQDMAGNVYEWCWDLYGAYALGAQSDPRGAASGATRVCRGGSWYGTATNSRVAIRRSDVPEEQGYPEKGFRVVRSSVHSTAATTSDLSIDTRNPLAAVQPVVVGSETNISINAATLTITGTDFDAVTPGNNTVSFTPSGSGIVTAATATSLTVTSLSGLSLGALHAVVTTSGQSSGAPVQVATVTPLPPAPAQDPIVSHLAAVQRAGTKLVDITYDLAADAATVAVSLQISGDGGVTFAVPAVAVTGAVGPAVGPGTGKALTWNAGADWNGQFSAQVQFKLFVSDRAVTAGMVRVVGGGLPGESWAGAQSVDGFHIGKYEVQWSEWQSVHTWALTQGYSIGEGSGLGAEYPVTHVNWYDVLKWCNARSEQEGLAPVYTVGGAPYRTGEVVPDISASAKGYRLPSEKEWEFAARGGVSTHSYTYSGSNDINAVAWYQSNSGDATHVAGTKLANELGIFDLSGNVWEWCFDAYPGGFRMLRGGSWGGNEGDCRVAGRSFIAVNGQYGGLGFRAALSSVPSTTVTTSDLSVDTRDPLAWTLFSAAEAGLAVADVGLVGLSPLDKLSVVGGVEAHDGAAALKFMAVDGASSYAERSIEGPALVSFWWRVSSEEVYDVFSYSVDGVVQESISGEGVWLKRSLSLAAGRHALRWTYLKDGGDKSFQDAGFLDELVVVEAYRNLEVSQGGAAVAGSATLDYGTVKQDDPEVAKAITFKNTGTVVMPFTASLPADGGFVFANGQTTWKQSLAAGQEATLSLIFQTSIAGAKSVLLQIVAAGSRTDPPFISLSGFIQAPILRDLAVINEGSAIAGSATFDYGAVKQDDPDVAKVITLRNSGILPLPITASLPAGGGFVFGNGLSTWSESLGAGQEATLSLILQTDIAGPKTALLELVAEGSRTAPPAITLSGSILGRVLQVAGDSIIRGSFFNSGTAAAWEAATTSLPGGTSGAAIKTGSTPDNGHSTIGARFDGPGLLRWQWKVSSQQNYDWLVCEVNGVEVAGISTKAAAWQSQVIQVPAGAEARWIYRKDAANQSGTDSGYLSGVRFDKFTVAVVSFNDWSAAQGGIAPLDLTGPGKIQGLFAWLGGFDPATGPDEGQYLPTVSGGFYRYRYAISKTAGGQVQPQASSDLATWNSRGLRQTLLSENEATATVELAVPAVAKIYTRLKADVPAYYMVKVAGGALPADSWAGAQSVDAFYIGKYEVRWSEWQSVLTWALGRGYDIGAGAGAGAEYPVTNVSWYDVLKWCNARSEQEGLPPVYTVGGAPYRTGGVVPDVSASATGYRLPSEKEWEFAARGGVSTQGYIYSGSNDVNAVAWYQSNSGGATHVVGTKLGNELGLFDLSGNAWEWCFDVYAGSNPVNRGGSWGERAYYCQAAFRSNYYPEARYGVLGFRVVRSSVP